MKHKHKFEKRAASSEAYVWRCIVLGCDYAKPFEAQQQPKQIRYKVNGYWHELENVILPPNTEAIEFK